MSQWRWRRRRAAGFAEISWFTLQIMGLPGLAVDNLCNLFISRYLRV
jgi:hypothetical protein